MIALLPVGTYRIMLGAMGPSPNFRGYTSFIAAGTRCGSGKQSNFAAMKEMQHLILFRQDERLVERAYERRFDSRRVP